MNLLSSISKIFSKKNEDIIIVSGLPRSGTSMMMRTLEMGGIPLLTDHLRTADDDNPHGYYELEIVKKLPAGEYEWLKDARGKAVKIISELLRYLPAEYSYKIIFMRRNMEEILASQKKMLINRDEDPAKIDDENMSKMFRKHLKYVNEWINSHANFKRIDIEYNRMVKDPGPCIEQLNLFLQYPGLDMEKMRGAVDKKLYRHRNT